MDTLACELLNTLLPNSTSLLLVAFCAILLVYATGKPAGIPPGPLILIPGLGNIPNMLGGDPLASLQTLRRKYGDVYSIFIGRQHIVILSGYDTIRAALVGQGGVFSNRPRDALLNDCIKGNKGIIYSSGPEWEAERAFVANALRQLKFGRSAFEKNILDELKSLIALCGNTNGESIYLTDYLKFSVANIIGVIIRGERAEFGDPVFMKFLSNQERSTKLLVNGSVMLNSFPCLQYLPGDLFGVDFVIESVRYSKIHFSKTYADHCETFDGNNVRDLMDAYIQRNGKGKCPNEALEVFNDLFGAGTETTTTTLLWIILYLINFPVIQDKCRREIHQALGKCRYPTMSDKPNLPYITATIMEGLRISNAVVMGTPHAVSKDTVFKGMVIPKNATLLMNMQSVFHNPELYPNPSEFKPERFLNESGQVKEPEHFIPFGIGRRVCLGMSAARMELFLFLTALIQRFEFLPESKIAPPMKGELGVTYVPLKYKVRCIQCK